MSEAFAHLHVASGFSLRYGASTPATLVERAAAHGQPALALTDRDGLYGAVRFVQACDEAGIAPVLGVDLAVSAPVSWAGRPCCLSAGDACGVRAPDAPRAPAGPGQPRARRSRGRPAPPARHRPRPRTGRWGRPGCRVGSAVPPGDQHPPVRRAWCAGQQPGPASPSTRPTRRPGTSPSPSCSAPPPTWAVPCSSGVPTGRGRCCMPGWTCCRAAASSSRWSTTAARRAPPPASGTPRACWAWPRRPGCLRS